MFQKSMSRRQLLRSLGMGVAGITLAACQPKVVEVEKIVTQVVEGPGEVVEVEKEVTRVVPAAAAPAEKAVVRFMARAGTETQVLFSDQWNEANPNVQIKREDAAWEDLATKVEAQAATGTLADVVFQTVYWFPYLARKGVWLCLDDLIAARDPGMDDFYPWVVDVCSSDDKVYAFPEAVHPGKCQLAYNKTLFEEKGVPLPTLEWDWDDWTEAGLALNDKDKGIWGICQVIKTLEVDSTNFRNFDGNIIDLEGKKVALQDEMSLEGLKAIRERIVDMRISPKTEEMIDGLGSKTFLAGLAATMAENLGSGGWAEAIGDKFEWGLTLVPKGPRGTRGSLAFANQFVINSKTKVPQEAYDFVTYLTSPASARALPLLTGKQPIGRISAWTDPEVEAKNPIYKMVHDNIFSQGVQPFPMPYNTRFVEANDLYTNEMTGIYQGNQTIEEYLPVVAEKLQKVLDQPLP